MKKSMKNQLILPSFNLIKQGTISGIETVPVEVNIESLRV